MNKVLIVTYYWPPGSGAGVQRWLKFAKYLPATGWEPVVLTVQPGYATYPAMDNGLEDEVVQGLEVHRTKATDYFRLYRKDKSKIPGAGFAINKSNSLTGKIIRFIRGNFFIPDPRKGWNRYAIKKASELIEKEKIRYVITTSPPHSTQLAGLSLKKKFPYINWIADLRDPWTDIYYYDSFYHTCPARKIDARYEKEVLRRADRIITVGPTLKKSFSLKYPAGEDKIVVITNGYDPDDFKNTDQQKPETFTISYTGTLSDAYPLKGFLEAINILQKRGFRIRLRFIGALTADQKNVIASAADAGSTEFIPYVDHMEAIRYMVYSSLLLLIIPEHHSNKSIITGKLFEYLASRVPVLCLGPADGDAAGILEKTGHGLCADYHDSERIKEIVESIFNESEYLHKSDPSEFGRDKLTLKLAELLEQSGVR